VLIPKEEEVEMDLDGDEQRVVEFGGEGRE